MGLKERFADWVIGNRADDSEAEVIALDAMNPLLAVFLRQETVTKAQAMDVPTFAGCVRFISETVAGLPVKLYREEDGEVTELRDDPRPALINDDTGDMLNGWQFKQAIAADLVVEGGGYAYIRRSRNTVEGLHYVARQHMTFLPGADPIYKNCGIAVNGARYSEHQFIKATRKTADGVRGVGALQENQLILAVAHSILQYENTLVKTGGNRRGFIKSEKKLEPKALDELRKRWKEFNESEKAAIMTLNAGLTFQETSATSVEQQLNERKKVIANEICRLFGVSESVLGGSPTEQEYFAAVKIAVLPVIAIMEAAFNHDLLLEVEKPNHYFSFDTKELLRGSIETRFKAYSDAIRSNVLQIDEARKMEDLPPLGLTFVKLGLQDVLYDPKKKIFFIPNMNQKGDFDGPYTPMGEERAFDYIQDPATGRMQGSRPNPKNMLILNPDGGNMGLGVTSINYPIEQSHPADVLFGEVRLNKHQQEILDKIPKDGDQTVVKKNEVSMLDLSAMTAKTGDEFAMFTRMGERLIVRGDSKRVPITENKAKDLRDAGYRWSGHTHPGFTDSSLIVSTGDRIILEVFGQEESSLYNAAGRHTLVKGGG